MSRDLRFSVWDSLEKRIVYGEEIETKTQRDNTQVYHAGLSYGDLFVGRFDDKGDWHELPVMQWTGLTDKNGNPVFEGDVVVWFVNGRTRTGIVEYVAESCCYDLKNFHDKYHLCNDWYRGEYEVIGNIYQDSHLLEEPQ